MSSSILIIRSQVHTDSPERPFRCFKLKYFISFSKNDDFINFKLCIFQSLSGLSIWRANYMSTCSPASSIPSTTSFSGWHVILVKNIVFHKESQICVIKWNTFYIKNIFQHLNIPHCCRRLRKVKIFFFTF